MDIMIDSNVIISAALFPNPRTNEFLRCISENHRLFLSSYSMDEVFCVIQRKFPTRKAMMERWHKMTDSPYADDVVLSKAQQDFISSEFGIDASDISAMSDVEYDNFIDRLLFAEVNEVDAGKKDGHRYTMVNEIRECCLIYRKSNFLKASKAICGGDGMPNAQSQVHHGF
jgi:hypothetical protein